MKSYCLNFFVGVPILLDDHALGFIICGRDLEKIPYNPPLDKGDTDTMTALAGLIASVAQNKKMMDLRLQMLEQIEEKNEIVNTFSQQVSRDVATALMNSREEKGSRKKVAVMFLDIRNFTPFVQNKQPEETVSFLNALFGFMTEIIDQYKVIINQFLGDGFMTTFGAPVVVDNPFQNAVDAALNIHKTLQEKIASGALPPTMIGIGIHGGEAVTGNVGSATRKQYTITGNVVIIAARIEQLTKQYNAQILISGDIQKGITSNTCTGASIGPVALKGLTEPIEIYQLI
jgi:adenylate cyclase